MKNIVASILFVFVVAAAAAQDKVTKANVVGKWTIESVEMTGMVYYNLAKDSIAFGDAIKQSVPASDLGNMSQIMKDKLSVFAKQQFAYNADGTAELTDITGNSLKGTYTVDEAKSLIITKDQTRGELSLPATITNGKLRMNLTQAEGAIFVVLKRNL